jgi:phosphate transport system permease protein
MARPWERLFIAAARLVAGCVILVPFVVLAVLVLAAVTGQKAVDPVFFLGNLVVQLFVTLVIAAIATMMGASIGIGTALLTNELLPARLSATIGLSIRILSAFPAVVLGWFGAVSVLPALPRGAPEATFAAIAAVVILAVIPRAHLLAIRVLSALPQTLRETAAAAGATSARVAAHVTLPVCKQRIAGIYADAFSRAVGEAAAVTVVFLAAARAGYPVSIFTLPSVIMTHARTLQAIDAGIALCALLIAVFAASSKVVAARRIGSLQWV